MIDQQFPSVTALPDFPARVAELLHGGERVLWRGQAGVAEYAFDQHASLPRWTLPETTTLIVTDQRVMYAHSKSDSPDDLAVTSGELRWLWPQHLRVQPGSRETNRASAVTQIQLVCGGADGSWPALVFAGGDLRTVADADRLANVLRQAIARFRVDNAGLLGLTTAQSRMLSRLLIGPEFSNYQGGPGQTVSIQGALPATRPATPDPEASPSSSDPAPAPTGSPVHRAPEPPPRDDPAQSSAGSPRAGRDSPALVGEDATRVISVRPGIAADMARALQAAKAEAATQEAQPDLASRAADLAARVANLVSEFAAMQDDDTGTASVGYRPVEDHPGTATAGAAPSGHPPVASHRAERAYQDLDAVDDSNAPTTDLTERAATLRRMAARFAANSAGNKAGIRRADHDFGTPRGNRSL